MNSLSSYMEPSGSWLQNANLRSVYDAIPTVEFALAAARSCTSGPVGAASRWKKFLSLVAPAV
jgi:hypothetical protein